VNTVGYRPKKICHCYVYCNLKVHTKVICTVFQGQVQNTLVHTAINIKIQYDNYTIFNDKIMLLNINKQ
jgi:hypothetical protein